MSRETPAAAQPDLLQGTLDMMVLQTLADGPNHGYGVARLIRHASGDVLHVEEGSLYPALHRLQKRGYLKANWRQTQLNRRAKFYTLTPRGQAQLRADSAAWTQLSGAIARVMSAPRLPAASADALGAGGGS